MHMIQLDNVALHYRIQGDPGGKPIVFANSLGTDFRLWDGLYPLLPAGYKIVRFDLRGHGLSGTPDGDWRMQDLVEDTAQLLRALHVRDCLFVGLSIGGIIAQGLAATHPDLVRTMVLANTGARIGTPEMWQERIEAVQSGGVEALADAVMQRWFAKSYHQKRALEMAGWRNMLTRTPAEGYIGCSRAIAATDYREQTAKLTLPTLAIAGAEDGSTPPELVQETADLIAGSRYELIDDAAHLTCVEQTGSFARLLIRFMHETGHV